MRGTKHTIRSHNCRAKTDCPGYSSIARRCSFASRVLYTVDKEAHRNPSLASVRHMTFAIRLALIAFSARLYSPERLCLLFSDAGRPVRSRGTGDGGTTLHLNGFRRGAGESGSAGRLWRRKNRYAAGYGPEKSAHQVKCGDPARLWRCLLCGSRSRARVAARLMTCMSGESLRHRPSSRTGRPPQMLVRSR